MRRVHQADDGVVDAAMEELALVPAWARVRHADARWLALRRRRLAAGGGHVDPDEPVLLAHRIGFDLDVRRLDRLAADEGGYRCADAVAAEAPAVIGAFDRVVRQHLAGRERHAAMRADVLHREGRPVAAAADQHRLAQHHLAAQARLAELFGQAAHVPTVAQEPCVGGNRNRLGRHGWAGAGAGAGGGLSRLSSVVMKS